MNSTRRGAPVPVAPVFSIPVMRPKLAAVLIVEGLPLTEPTLAPGVLYCGWFIRLNAAARKFRRTRSVTWNRFWSEESISYVPGPLAMKRPRLPQVPLAGAAKAAGLNQFVMLWFAA